MSSCPNPGVFPKSLTNSFCETSETPETSETSETLKQDNTYGNSSDSFPVLRACSNTQSAKELLFRLQKNDILEKCEPCYCVSIQVYTNEEINLNLKVFVSITHPRILNLMFPEIFKKYSIRLSKNFNFLKILDSKIPLIEGYSNCFETEMKTFIFKSRKIVCVSVTKRLYDTSFKSYSQEV